MVPSLDVAIKLHESGDIDAAERAYRRILAEKPGDPGALHLLGVIRQQQGRHKEAVELIGRAIVAKPGQSVFHNNYGAALLSLERYAEAEDSFRRALLIRPDYADALANLGMAQAALGDDGSAEESLRKALRCQPWHADATKRLAGLLQRRGRPEEARQLLESALVAARSPQLHLALGNLLLAAGEAENAAQHYRAAMQTCVTPRAKGPLTASDRLVYDGTALRDIFRVGEDANAQDTRPKGDPSNAAGKVAFVSPHCLLDFTNGAATTTLDGLKLLRNLGFACEAFCGTRRDAPDVSRLEDVLARCGERYAVRDAQFGDFQARMGFASIASCSLLPAPCFPVTLVDTGSALGPSANTEGIAAFLAGCEFFLARFRPDVVWTYGGDPLSLAVQHIAKEQGIPILFAVHNSTYSDRAVFGMADRVVVPAEFSRTYYRQALRLTCDVLPNVVNWEAAEVSMERGTPHPNPLPNGEGTRRDPYPGHRRGRYLTFINPEGIKGVFVFARVARELARRRPDIPILVAQGRSRADALMNPALGLAEHLYGELLVANSQGPKNSGQANCASTTRRTEVDRASRIRPAKAGTPAQRGGRNIMTMPLVPVPRAFYPAVYSRTKLLLMPALCNETFGLVAAEAMLNGIPVLASNRGALPETIGKAGFLFEVPAKYTPDTREVPTAEEVEPWVETIIRLWDDAAEYERRSKAAREHAQKWRPDRLAPIYHEFFSCFRRQDDARPARSEAS